MFVRPYIALTTNTDFGQQFSNLIYSTVLTATVAQTLTVPGNAPRYKAVFAFDDTTDVWVGNNGTAVLPSGSFAASTTELRPRCREVNAGDILNFISPDGCSVSVAFYAVNVNS
jgi:hypothetical protein